MAEFENLSSGGGSPSPGKKKGKLDKKKIIIYGALGIFAFVLITALFRRPQQAQEESQGTSVDISGHGMPTNSVDVAAQMQSIQTQLLNAQEQKFNSIASDLSRSNAELVSDYGQLLKDTRQNYEDQLKEKTSKFNDFMEKDAIEDKLMADKLAAQQKALADQKKAAEESAKKTAAANQKTTNSLVKQINDLKNKLPVYKTQPVTKKPATPKPATPKPVTTKPKTQSITIKKGDTLSELAVKYKTSVSALMKLNPYIKDKNKIYAGKTLRVK